MQYLLLITVIILTTAQNVFQKQYNIKVKNPNVFLFGGIISLTAMLFFIISSGFKLSFTTAFLPYSVAFGISYAAANIGIVYSLRFGSMAISTLVVSYSLLIPTAYGVLVLNDDLSNLAYIGIALLLISIFLLNAKKIDMKFSLKWIVCIIIAFIGNGMCSTVQKMEQLQFDGAYKSEFMIAALLISAGALLIMAALQKGQNGKKDLIECVKLAGISGIANGVVNLFVMLLTGTLPNAILFPSISGGGIVLSFIIALFIYKEKLHKMQILGYVLGVLSVILLNL